MVNLTGETIAVNIDGAFLMMEPIGHLKVTGTAESYGATYQPYASVATADPQTQVQGVVKREQLTDNLDEIYGDWSDLFICDSRETALAMTLLYADHPMWFFGYLGPRGIVHEIHNPHRQLPGWAKS